MNLVSRNRTKIQGYFSELRNQGSARSAQNRCDALCLGSAGWLTGVLPCIVSNVKNQEETERQIQHRDGD
jgi:hypothetical protein